MRFEQGFDGTPANIDADVLVSAVRRVAAAALLARHWPAQDEYDQMMVLYESFSIDCVSQLERELIEHSEEFARNMLNGGGGHIGKTGPYYLYVVLRSK